MFQEEKVDCHGCGDIVIARVGTAVGAALRAWTVSRKSVRLTAPTLTSVPLQIPDVDVTDIDGWWEDGCTHIKNA